MCERVFWSSEEEESLEEVPFVGDDEEPLTKRTRVDKDDENDGDVVSAATLSKFSAVDKAGMSQGKFCDVPNLCKTNNAWTVTSYQSHNHNSHNHNHNHSQHFACKSCSRGGK
jgi:hypothetical protein